MAANKKHSLISETESLEGPTSLRTSSIRFKEPESFDQEILVLREPPPPHAKVKTVSSLKSASSESRSRLLKSRTPTSATGSGESYYKSSPSKRNRPLPQFSNSFSLENVSFSPSVDTNITNRFDKKFLTKRKTWSYDDLDAIKRELSEPMSPYERYHSSLMLFDFIPKKTSVILASPRHRIDQLRLTSMTKDDILAMWRSSERELLNRLQETLQQKRALEEKVALLQRMLMKPP